MFEQLMSINGAAFDENDFATAFHVLASARHRAVWAKDVHQLRLVSAAAQRQCRELDERAPNHLLSTRSAATRGNRSVFAALEGTADLSVLMIEQTQRQLELARLMRVGPARAD